MGFTFNEEKWRRIKTLQKGSHFTGYLNKPLEDFIVYLLYDLRFITADLITIIADVLAFLTTYLIGNGSLHLALPLAYSVIILDGVDGKIARLRGKKTLIGKLEHSFDFLFEQAWYVAFVWYLFTSTFDMRYLLLGLSFIVLDGFVRHIYNIIWLATGESLRRGSRIERLITTIDGRRNVYFIYMLIFFMIKQIHIALIMMFLHALFTSITYIILAIRRMRRL